MEQGRWQDKVDKVDHAPLDVKCVHIATGIVAETWVARHIILFINVVFVEAFCRNAAQNQECYSQAELKKVPNVKLPAKLLHLLAMIFLHLVHQMPQIPDHLHHKKEALEVDHPRKVILAYISAILTEWFRAHRLLAILCNLVFCDYS